MSTIKDGFPITLVTDRLIMTTPTRAHVPAISALANNRRLHDVMAQLPFPYSEDDARFFVERIVPSEEELCYAVMLGGATFIGIVGLTLSAGSPPELGYWLGEPYWGKGYATEAAHALATAASTLGVPVLQSRIQAGNVASRNVLEKIGFSEVGQGSIASGTHAGKAAVFMRLEF